VPPAPVPGEASIESSPRTRSVVMIRNVALGTISDEIHVDAILDTGATHCIVPPSLADTLGFHSGNRLGVVTTHAVGGARRADRHCLEYVKAGTARANRISFLIDELGPAYRFVALLGLTFIKNFTTTVNFDENRVLFRSRRMHR